MLLGTLLSSCYLQQVHALLSIKVTAAQYAIFFQQSNDSSLPNADSPYRHSDGDESLADDCSCHS
jgi:hypothetical protein